MSTQSENTAIATTDAEPYKSFVFLWLNGISRGSCRRCCQSIIVQLYWFGVSDTGFGLTAADTGGIFATWRHSVRCLLAIRNRKRLCLLNGSKRWFRSWNRIDRVVAILDQELRTFVNHAAWFR